MRKTDPAEIEIREMSLAKFMNRVLAHGLFPAIKISVSKSLGKGRRKRIFSLRTAEDRFTEIYKTNHWNDPESRSGEGSTLENTKLIRSALPNLFKKYSISSVLDAPCGDFNWMNSVIKEAPIIYIGGDIVQPLIEENQSAYGSELIRFAKMDIMEDRLPKADLMICRDCLFHLSFRDITKFFANFIASELPFLLTTTNLGPDDIRVKNVDISTGDMRPIDLFSRPFNLSKDSVLEVVDDHMTSIDVKRYMVLLSRSEAEKMLENLNRELAET